MTKHSKLVEYHLSTDETANILGRQKFQGYVQDLINRDIQMYLYTTVLPRLGIDPKTPVELSEDGKVVRITNDKSK